MTAAASKPAIAIIGGTGALGSGLAKRWAMAGHRVILGSRSETKATDRAHELNQAIGMSRVEGTSYIEAVKQANVIAICVPYLTHDETLRELRENLAGKIVIDAVVPLAPPNVSLVRLPPGGSAGATAQAILGENVRVVSAFHNVGASKLMTDGPVECDVLVFGNDAEARELVVDLIAEIGMRGLHGGPIDNSVAAETMTAVLIGINRRYKVSDAGIRITGALAL